MDVGWVKLGCSVLHALLEITVSIFGTQSTGEGNSEETLDIIVLEPVKALGNCGPMVDCSRVL